MHILGSLFFLTALALAIVVIIASVVNDGHKIVSALLGRDIALIGNVVEVRAKPNNALLLRAPSVANEDFSLPLAA